MGNLIASLKGWIWDTTESGIEISVADKLNTGLMENLGVEGDLISLAMFCAMAAILLYVSLSKSKNSN